MNIGLALVEIEYNAHALWKAGDSGAWRDDAGSGYIAGEMRRMVRPRWRLKR